MLQQFVNATDILRWQLFKCITTCQIPTDDHWQKSHKNVNNSAISSHVILFSWTADTFYTSNSATAEGLRDTLC